jgi:TPR repeat protein
MSPAGMSYAQGRGVAKDESKAVHWWQAAAAQGVAEAQYNLGLRCFRDSFAQRV